MKEPFLVGHMIHVTSFCVDPKAHRLEKRGQQSPKPNQTVRVITIEGQDHPRDPLGRGAADVRPLIHRFKTMTTIPLQPI